MTITSVDIDTTDHHRPELLALITAATRQLVDTWETLTVAQADLLLSVRRMGPRPTEPRTREAFLIFNRRVGVFDRDTRALIERWAAVDLPTAYRDGALRALAQASQDVTAFAWTTDHQAALTALTATFWADLIRRIVEAVRRAHAFVRAAQDEARTNWRGIDTGALSKAHPLDTVIYSNDAHHPIASWAGSALHYQGVVAANTGAVNTTRLEMGAEWVEIVDGPECVMPGGGFLPHGHLQQMVRAWFSGPAYSIHGRTASGPNLLTVGPNHPVLTSRGWVRAHLLREGDQLVYDRLSEDPATRTEFHLEQIPMIEDVYASMVKAFPVAVRPATGDDLHGDGKFCQGEVDVVSIAGSLLTESDSAPGQHLGEHHLMRTDDRGAGLVGPGNPPLRFDRVGNTSDSFIGCPGATFPGVGPGVRMPHGKGLAPAAADPHVADSAVDLGQVQPKGIGDLRRLAGLFEVKASYLLAGDDYRPPVGAVVSAEPPLAVPAWMEAAPAGFTDAGDAPIPRGLDQRISFSRIESIRIDHYEGWVFDASTSGGTFTVDGIIVANCGWTSHEDIDHASGSIRSLEDATTYPIAHHGCLREIIPRPDLTGRPDITSGDSV